MVQPKNEKKVGKQLIKVDIQCTRPNFTLRINESIPAKGITAIFGRSGAGKTTLINAISGLITPNSGSIDLCKIKLYDSEQGINIPPEKRAIGYVFQDARLFPHMSVLKNLLYGAKGISNQLEQLISSLGIEHLLKRYPNTLSGGEKQRVAIGRALLSTPNLLIMDEPTASLDLPRRTELIDYLLRLTQHLSMPVLYISHHLDEIMRLADHMLVLEQGNVVANGPLNEVWHLTAMQPWFSAKEHSSLLNARIMQPHKDYPLTALKLASETLWVPLLSEPVGSMVRFRVFSSDVSISKTKAQDSSIRNLIAAKVVKITPQPKRDYCYITLSIGGQYIIANITQWAADELALMPNMQIFAQFKGISIAKTDVSLANN